jgi:hypothetical protein
MIRMEQSRIFPRFFGQERGCVLYISAFNRHKKTVAKDQALVRDLTKKTLLPVSQHFVSPGHSLDDFVRSKIYIIDHNQSWKENQVKEVNHIRRFAIDIAKDLILLSCRLAMEHLQVLSPIATRTTLVATWLTLADRR